MTLAQQLSAVGFVVTETGGGCTAWRIELPRGGYILVTDTGGGSHDVTSADDAVIGVYDSEGETIVVTVPASNAESPESDA